MVKSTRPLQALLCALFLSAAGPLLPEGLSVPPGEPGREEINFIVLGDWGRRGGGQQLEVARRMGEYAREHETDFIISTGDNFYERGVDGVGDEHWRESFLDVYTSPSLDAPWFAVLGNHDYRGDTRAQIEYSRFSERWKMPSRYYAFEKDLGSERALFAFLDTNPFVGRYGRRKWFYPDLVRQDPDAQLRWLDETLEGSSAKWKIVVGHHPVFSGGGTHGPTVELVNRLLPLLEKHGVQAYFSGHEHSLQHVKPPGPVHFIISGAGSRTRPVGGGAGSRFAGSACGFAAVSLGDRGLHLEFVDFTGQSIYRAKIGTEAEDAAVPGGAGPLIPIITNSPGHVPAEKP